MIGCARFGYTAIYCADGQGGPMYRLDTSDERILAELAEHARATFAEIGQKVNLSAPAVKRRVDRMLDNGVIRGFTFSSSTASLNAIVVAPLEADC